MPHPEHERIKMSDSDDASHQHFVNYYRKASKTNIFDLIYIAVWLRYTKHHEEELFTQWMYAGIISKHQLNMNSIFCLISNKLKCQSISCHHNKILI